MKHKLTINTAASRRTIYADEGKNLHALLLENVFFISAPCGGNGRCGKCKIKAKGAFRAPYGEVPEATELLACKAYPTGDCEIFKEGSAKLIRRKKTSDAKRLGIAFDIGTTGISAVLCDLDTREELDTLTVENVQRSFGADVITRLMHEPKKLTDVLIVQINDIISEMTKDPLSVSKITFAANTVMSHFLLSLSPEGLTKAPFEAKDTFGEIYSPESLGLICKNAEVYIFPSLGSFVGGDISAGLFALDILSKSSTSLLLDIGTNGEAALWKNGTLYITSAAAGPAFEGTELSCGMTAESGAVIAFDGNVFTTVDGTQERGIAGSGAIDILASLLSSGAIDNGGRLLPPDETPAFRERIDTKNGEVCFNISDSVFLTASDIRKLQLAKAAIRASVSLLLKKSETNLSDIKNFYIAGAFGASFNKASAEAIGLIPGELSAICTPCRNAALRGATLALFEDDIKEKLAPIKSCARHIDLSGDPDFENEFLNFIPM